MRTPLTWLSALMVAVLFGTGCTTPEKTDVAERHKATELFNGIDLKGWEHVLADPSVSRDQVWTVEQGILKCSGTPVGVLYTGPAVQDFHLVVEYRWAPGTKPGNSGIFSRIDRPVTALPRAIEVQLKHADAGHVLGLQGKPVTLMPGPRAIAIKAHPVAGDISGVSRLADAERPPGEWNRVEILAQGPRYRVWMNGQLVNDASGVDVSKGKIGIQSEGGEIHFRQVQLTPLD